VPTTPISSLFCSQNGGRVAIGANPAGSSTLVSTLMPLVISNVVERARNGGGAGLGAGAVEHAPRLAAQVRIRMRTDLGIEKR